MGFAHFLETRGIQRNFSGRIFGARVLTASASLGPFLAATFRHPTKKATTGRFGSILWRNPRTA